MSQPDLQERMRASGLRLAEAERAAFAEIVAATDQIAERIRAAQLSYADEPATCFRAPHS